MIIPNAQWKELDNKLQLTTAGFPQESQKVKND